ncbi:helix-turn-helix transcriptional regulator [Paenibacillus sp. WQ 127069]|uniref:Helix-turn-helix transcriptional regulator n=1 Tax=Paenibacillus baimaensis TaxID=2982185 RepID=A0ABT2UHA6_9BACL|nr:helix-turn-helix transcriptional regulator [Paenibacillus sp. WQ 127069]MCU6793990.1 helix-turn-helix transcriptional regulator [Paenibacillus sp. WQ 127069]
MIVKKLKLTVDSHIHNVKENEKLAVLHSMILREVSALDFSDKVVITWESIVSSQPDKAEQLVAAAAEVGVSHPPVGHPLYKLSERQRQVAELLCSHYSVKKIANILYVSENTVKKHSQNIKKALEIEQSGTDFIYTLKQMIDNG